MEKFWGKDSQHDKAKDQVSHSAVDAERDKEGQRGAILEERLRKFYAPENLGGRRIHQRYFFDMDDTPESPTEGNEDEGTEVPAVHEEWAPKDDAVTFEKLEDSSEESDTKSLEHMNESLQPPASVPSVAATAPWMESVEKPAVWQGRDEQHGLKHDENMHDENMHDGNTYDENVYDGNMHDENMHDGNTHDENMHDENVKDNDEQHGVYPQEETEQERLSNEETEAPQRLENPPGAAEIEAAEEDYAFRTVQSPFSEPEVPASEAHSIFFKREPALEEKEPVFPEPEPAWQKTQFANELKQEPEPVAMLDETLISAMEFESQLKELCQFKAEEFHLLGYNQLSAQHVWGSVARKWRRMPALHEAVADILSAKVGDVMTYLTVSALKGDADT